MSSQTTIANMALAHFGQSRLNDISDDSVAGEVVREFWDNARRSSLRGAPWGFALKQAELTVDITAPLFCWSQQYPLPSDFLRLVSVNGRYAGTKITDFEIQGTMLMSNCSQAKIVYVRDVTETGYWPEDFALAFSYRLAGLVAPRLMADGGNAAVAMMQQAYQAALPALQNDKAETLPRRVSALEGSAYQRARFEPAPGTYPCIYGEGLPLQFNVQFNPYSVGP